MPIKNNPVSSYAISANNFLLSEYDFSADRLFVLNDRKTIIGNKEMLENYFDTVYKVFLEKLEKFKELECQASAEEIKNLTNMFKTLLDAQKMICGKKEE